MTERIKVTGYVSLTDYDESDLDRTDPSGLSPRAYDELNQSSIDDLEDVRIELVAE
jgi:hypothetical protein